VLCAVCCVLCAALQMRACDVCRPSTDPAPPPHTRSRRSAVCHYHHASGDMQEPDGLPEGRGGWQAAFHLHHAGHPEDRGAGRFAQAVGWLSPLLLALRGSHRVYVYGHPVAAQSAYFLVRHEASTHKAYVIILSNTLGTKLIFPPPTYSFGNNSFDSLSYHGNAYFIPLPHTRYKCNITSLTRPRFRQAIVPWLACHNVALTLRLTRS